MGYTSGSGSTPMRTRTWSAILPREVAVSRLLGCCLIALVAAACVATATATAPPVGPLPKGTTTTISAPAQSYVAVALDRGQSGLVWRVARAYDARVVVGKVERNLGDLTIWIFQTVRPGSTTVRFALTNGERPKAYKAASYRIVVRPRSTH
jgi:hypothetical protein